MNLPGVISKSRGDKITVVSSRANLKVTTTYSGDFDDGFSQLTRVFFDQDGGLRWTEVDTGRQGWTDVWSQVGHCLVIFVGVRFAVGFVG